MTLLYNFHVSRTARPDMRLLKSIELGHAHMHLMLPSWLFIYQRAKQCIIHGDFKTGNILINIDILVGEPLTLDLLNEAEISLGIFGILVWSAPVLCKFPYISTHTHFLRKLYDVKLFDACPTSSGCSLWNAKSAKSIVDKIA